MRVLSCPTCHAAVHVSTEAEAGTVTCEACHEVFRPADLRPPAAGEPAPPEPVPGTYPVTTFAATRGGSPLGLFVPLVTGLIGAVVLAVLCLILRSFFWLVIVFPALHGLGVGAAVGVGGRLARNRLHVALAVVAVGCALASWLGVHFLNYLAFAADPNAPPVGFWEFMDARASEGVRIGKPGAADNNRSNLGYTGTIIYWAVEVVVTAAAAAAVAVGLVSSPFCAACNAWKRKRALGPFRVEPAVAARAVAVGVPAAVVAPADGQKKVTLVVYTCPHCGDQGTIDVKLIGSHTEGKQTANYSVFMTYPGDAEAAFEQAAGACRAQGLAAR